MDKQKFVRWASKGSVWAPKSWVSSELDVLAKRVEALENQLAKIERQ